MLGATRQIQRQDGRLVTHAVSQQYIKNLSESSPRCWFGLVWLSLFILQYIRYSNHSVFTTKMTAFSGPTQQLYKRVYPTLLLVHLLSRCLRASEAVYPALIFDSDCQSCLSQLKKWITANMSLVKMVAFV